jgi:hypothetical protein
MSIRADHGRATGHGINQLQPASIGIKRRNLHISHRAHSIAR